MNAAFAAVGLDAEMIAMPVPPERIATALAGLRKLPMLGASVTVPHKLAVIASCARLSPEAHAIGAVNCLALEGDNLIGHNTDCGGFVDAVGGLDGARVVLLGAGGAARAVAHGASEAGAIVDVIARTPATWTTSRPWADLRDAFARADLVVDCTPTGLDPELDAEFTAQLPLDVLAPSARVATLVYHRRTNLIERASARGHSTIDGRAMLVHQAARAFTIWTHLPAPLEVMSRALDESL